MKFAPILALSLTLSGYMAASLAGDDHHNQSHRSKGRDNKTNQVELPSYDATRWINRE